VMKYTTLLFDVDNTLLDFTLSEKTAVSIVLENNGIEPSEENVLCYSAINDRFWKRFERGEIEKSKIYEGRFEVLLYELGIKGDAAKMSQEYADCLSKQYFVIDGAMELLEKLSKSHNIYFTTNGRANTQRERIKYSGIEKFSKGTFVSEEIGFQKPQKEYFNYVLEKVEEKEKSKIIVIGDSPSSDILGGINVGLDTVWYNPKGEKAQYPATYIVESLEEIPNIV